MHAFESHFGIWLTPLDMVDGRSPKNQMNATRGPTIMHHIVCKVTIWPAIIYWWVGGCVQSNFVQRLINLFIGIAFIMFCIFDGINKICFVDRCKAENRMLFIICTHVVALDQPWVCLSKMRVKQSKFFPLFLRCIAFFPIPLQMNFRMGIHQ